MVITGSPVRRFTGGQSEFEVAATSFGKLVKELDERFPGLGKQVEESMAVAIDGIIYQDSFGAEFGANSEVVLIPKIGGG